MTTRTLYTSGSVDVVDVSGIPKIRQHTKRQSRDTYNEKLHSLLCVFLIRMPHNVRLHFQDIIEFSCMLIIVGSSVVLNMYNKTDYKSISVVIFTHIQTLFTCPHSNCRVIIVAWGYRYIISTYHRGANVYFPIISCFSAIQVSSECFIGPLSMWPSWRAGAPYWPPSTDVDPKLQAELLR